MNTILEIARYVDDFFWRYIGLYSILIIGSYLTIKSKFFQVQSIFNFFHNVKELIFEGKQEKIGIHPIKLVFASVGGMVGVGNIVFIGVAVFIGGPGSIFWIWIGFIFGSLIKYSEIYLAIKYRVKNQSNNYDGGIMYYVKHAFNSSFLSIFVSILLCVYTVEVYQFNVLVERLHYNFFQIDKRVIVFALLCLVIYSSIGGISRLSNICTVLMPIFLVMYLAVGIYIIAINSSVLVMSLKQMIYFAFNNTDPIGSFKGSTPILSAYMGISKGVYAGDIGVGYDSVIQSETKTEDPKKQAKFAIYSLLSNTIICTVTTMIIVVSGYWYKTHEESYSNIIGNIINEYFPVMGNYFVTLLLFLAGFTTVIASIAIGIKSSRFVSQKYGSIVYLLYVVVSLPLFSYTSQENVGLIVSISSGFILFINLMSIIKLRKEINF